MQIIGSVQSHIKIIFFEMSKAMSCLANRTINYESFKNTGTPPLTQFFGPGILKENHIIGGVF